MINTNSNANGCCNRLSVCAAPWAKQIGYVRSVLAMAICFIWEAFCGASLLRLNLTSNIWFGYIAHTLLCDSCLRYWRTFISLNKHVLYIVFNLLLEKTAILFVQMTGLTKQQKVLLVNGSNLAPLTRAKGWLFVQRWQSQ